MLCDEDARIRTASSAALASMVERMYFSADDANRNPVVCTAVELAREALHPVVGDAKNDASLSGRLFKGTRASR
jgi:hypothetical protein